MSPKTLLSFEKYPELFSKEFGGWDAESQVFVRVDSYTKLRKYIETVDIGKPRGPGRRLYGCGYVLDCIAAAVEYGETDMHTMSGLVFKQARDWSRLVEDLQVNKTIRYTWLNERHYYSISKLLGWEAGTTYPELGESILSYFRNLKVKDESLAVPAELDGLLGSRCTDNAD